MLLYRCRSWTAGPEAPPTPRPSDHQSQLLTTDPVQQWRLSWAQQCLCGSPWMLRHSHSHTHTLTHTHSFTLTLIHTHSHSHSLLTHTHTHCSLTHTHTHMQGLVHTLYVHTHPLMMTHSTHSQMTPPQWFLQGLYTTQLPEVWHRTPSPS